jgi:glucan-binding YG repeat protein
MAVLIPLLGILLFTSQAHAGDLSTWGSYFSHTQSVVNTYRFALYRPFSDGRVFHVEGNTITYCYGDTVASTRLGTTIPTQAQSRWKNYLTFSKTSLANANVIIGYEQFAPLAVSPGSLASTAFGSNDADTNGVIYKNGCIVMTFYASSTVNLSDATLSSTFAHEMGHVAGLADVYDLSLSANRVSMNIMYSENTNSASVYDLNGLYITRHNPWYRSIAGGPWSRWNSPGVLMSGWHKIDGYWYYFNSLGTMLTGFQKINGSWYYFFGGDDGRMATGFQKINGNWFYFFGGDSGRIATGWQTISGGQFYFLGGDSGRMLMSWQYLNKDGTASWFYLNPEGESGRMLTTQWISPSSPGNNSSYWAYVGSDGRAKTGWNYLPDTGGSFWYYFDTNANMKTGWLSWDGSWFYLRSSANYPSTGPQGSMVTAWQWVKDTNGVSYWFYFTTGSSGRMYVNKVQSDGGGNCYLKSNGRAAQSETIYIVPWDRTYWVNSSYHIAIH